MSFTDSAMCRMRAAMALPSFAPYRRAVCQHRRTISMAREGSRSLRAAPGCSLALACPGHEVFASRASAASAIARAERDPGPRATRSSETLASPERERRLARAFARLARVSPAHAQCPCDRFPGIIRNGIQVLLGELQAAPYPPGVLGLGPQRRRELAPDAELLELADRKPHGETWNAVGQVEVIDSVAAVRGERHVRHGTLRCRRLVADDCHHHRGAGTMLL